MPSCRYCYQDVGHSAEFCPNCGEKDPQSISYSSSSSDTKGYTDTWLDLLPFDPVRLLNIAGAMGAVAGLVIGGNFGFDIGGVGGAIIFGLIGVGLGFIAGAVAPIAAALALQYALLAVLVVGGIVLVIWFFVSLWGVGK